MKILIQQIGLFTAAKQRGHSYANAHAGGCTRVSGIEMISAYDVLDRCDSLLAGNEEPMT